MADETGEVGGAEAEDADAEGQSGSAEAAQGKEPEERGGRMDAAKAWMRSLYAGSDDAAPDAGAPAGDSGYAAQSGPCRNCQFMEGQIAEIEQKSGEWENLYRRMTADFENYRRRMDREREEFQAVGVQKAAEALIPALDDMDRAMMSLTPDMAPEKIMESVKLVFGRISQCLSQIGVKPLSSVGEPFDPKFHEPVQEVETTEVPDGHVIQELRRGYTLNDKVIRPALVNVASNSGQPAPEREAAPSGQADESAPAAGEVYDLSDVDDSPDAEESLTKELDGYLEAPATGTTGADE